MTDNDLETPLDELMGVSMDKDLRASLECPSCKDLLVEPVLLTGCGHTFCSECLSNHLKRIKTCPVCRVACPPNPVIPCYSVREILTRVRRKCRRCESLYLGLPESHLSECPMAPVCVGCRIPVFDLKLHHPKCVDMFECCQGYYAKRDDTLDWETETELRKHRHPEGTCPSRWISCPHGCGTNFKPGQLLCHQKRCPKVQICRHCDLVIAESGIIRLDPKEHSKTCPRAPVCCPLCPEGIMVRRGDQNLHQKVMHPEKGFVPITSIFLRQVKISGAPQNEWVDNETIAYLFATFLSTCASAPLRHNVSVYQQDWQTVPLIEGIRRRPRARISFMFETGHDDATAHASFSASLRDSKPVVTLEIRSTALPSFAMRGDVFSTALFSSPNQFAVYVNNQTFEFPGGGNVRLSPDVAIAIQFSSEVPEVQPRSLNESLSRLIYQPTPEELQLECTTNKHYT